MSIVASGIVLIAVAAFVAGLVLLWQGWRGVPEFSEPFCRKCGYDLRGMDWSASKRTCPECGTDLTAAKAIHFGKHRKRPRRMMLGGMVLLMGLLLPFGVRLAFMLIQNRGRLTETNATVIANLAKTADQPWDWQKLENRYSAGQLSDKEAAAAVDQLIAHLAGNSARRRMPLPWADRFLKTLLADRVISTEQLGRICDAYYGPAPEVQMRKRIREGKKIDFRVETMGHWDFPGTQLLTALREVAADGRSVEVKPGYGDTKSKHYLSASRQSAPLMGELLSSLPPGSHELRFTFDRALAAESTRLKPGFDNRPGQSDRWPPVLVKQTVTATVKLEILPAGVQTVGLVSDPSLDPTKAISITGIDVLREGARIRLKPQIEIKDPPVPVMCRVFVEIGGQRHSLGAYGTYPHGTVSSSDGGLLEAPPASLKAVKVILEPDVVFAEDSSEVTQIWGKPITFENVPLERYDLENEESPATRPAEASSRPSSAMQPS